MQDHIQCQSVHRSVIAHVIAIIPLIIPWLVCPASASLLVIYIYLIPCAHPSASHFCSRPFLIRELVLTLSPNHGQQSSFRCVDNIACNRSETVLAVPTLSCSTATRCCDIPISQIGHRFHYVPKTYINTVFFPHLSLHGSSITSKPTPNVDMEALHWP